MSVPPFHEHGIIPADKARGISMFGPDFEPFPNGAHYRNPCPLIDSGHLTRERRRLGKNSSGANNFVASRLRRTTPTRWRCRFDRLGGVLFLRLPGGCRRALPPSRLFFFFFFPP